MEIMEMLQEFDISEEEYEKCLSDITDKLDGVSDLEWEDIKTKYNLPYNTDVLRKANGTIFGGYWVKKFLSRKNKNLDNNAIIDIRKEKQKLFDERAAIMKIKREEARFEEDFSKMCNLIAETGKEKYKPVAVKNIAGDTDLIVCLSDLHIGQDINSCGGVYNSDIAKKRLDDYFEEIVRIGRRNASQDVYVLCLGDSLSGNIHVTTQLENRENVVEQIVKASELVSEFIFKLSEEFNHVYINSVSGNHSRVGLKDNVLRGERLDDLIPWYAKAKLGHIKNITFIDSSDNFDSTIGKIIVRGKEYWLVHGDYDSFDQNGISKLVLMIGHKPSGIFYGHLHSNAYQSINDIEIIRSGSLCGTGDDYTMSKRIQGSPSQMVVVVDERGVASFNPVTFN